MGSQFLSYPHDWHAALEPAASGLPHSASSRTSFAKLCARCHRFGTISVAKREAISATVVAFCLLLSASAFHGLKTDRALTCWSLATTALRRRSATAGSEASRLCSSSGSILYR